MNRIFDSLAALSTVILVVCCSQATYATTYDAVSDFSLASNPNGPWSYGTLTSFTGGSFIPFSATLSDSAFAGERLWYTGNPQPNAASVIENASGSTAIFATVVLPTNLLNIDCENLIATVRWVAPATGIYDVTGLFQRTDTDNGVTVNLGIIKNGATSLLLVNNFTGFNNQVPISLNNLSLSAGATLDFAESAPQFNNDSVGLSATITAVPEPSALALLCTGAVALAGVLWCRGRRSDAASLDAAFSTTAVTAREGER